MTITANMQAEMIAISDATCCDCGGSVTLFLVPDDGVGLPVVRGPPPGSGDHGGRAVRRNLPAAAEIQAQADQPLLRRAGPLHGLGGFLPGRRRAVKPQSRASVGPRANRRFDGALGGAASSLSR
jgi:hypothetical protein